MDHLLVLVDSRISFVYGFVNWLTTQSNSTDSKKKPAEKDLQPPQLYTKEEHKKMRLKKLVFKNVTPQMFI